METSPERHEEFSRRRFSQVVPWRRLCLEGVLLQVLRSPVETTWSSDAIRTGMRNEEEQGKSEGRQAESGQWRGDVGVGIKITL